MRRDEFEPKIAVREERRQANEALGRSFCKTLAELITNSDSSGKRKHHLPQSSGLVDLMFQVSKGNQIDTAALKRQIDGKHARRRILIEIVAAKRPRRPAREIVIVDDSEGMSADALKTALEDIGGDRTGLASGMAGRNLFGRGLSDVMRAHQGAKVQTCDGRQLSKASGEWNPRWKIIREIEDRPKPTDFESTFLTPNTTGTAVRFIGSNKGFHIPDPENINSRLANFYMLRLIAADPNVELLLRQFRASGDQEQRVRFDFPVGQVVESFSRTFNPGGDTPPLRVDILIARSGSEHKLESLGADRDARENGMLIVDDLDAVYDLTFVDPDYERAEFLRHIFGVVRVNGLRKVLEDHLNSQDDPTSPLRVDRDGFNRDHEFSRKLLKFLGDELRPCYERERKRMEEGEQGKLSEESRRKVDDALKRLNKYFQQITEMAGLGQGVQNEDRPKPPTETVSFLPQSARLVVGQKRQVLLLVKDDAVSDGCELVATASAGFSVQPETEVVYRKTTRRWKPHPKFFCVPFVVEAHTVGKNGTVSALVESVGGQTFEAVLRIEDTLEEPSISPPATMEFRPSTSTGRPNRRNGITLYVNSQLITAGHYVRLKIVKRAGAIELIDAAGTGTDQFDVKLNMPEHGVRGQDVFRVRIPWRGTGWNQHATIEARVKIGPDPIVITGKIRLDEPDPNEGGFFQRVEYDDLDDPVPSKFAAGIITINMRDPLNQDLFGTGPTKEEARKEFDRRLSRDPKAQQRLASLLLEETSFRMLEQLRDDNKLHLPEKREITAIHDEIDKHKFKLAVELYTALVK